MYICLYVYMYMCIKIGEGETAEVTGERTSLRREGCAIVEFIEWKSVASCA